MARAAHRAWLWPAIQDTGSDGGRCSWAVARVAAHAPVGPVRVIGWAGAGSRGTPCSARSWPRSSGPPPAPPGRRRWTPWHCVQVTGSPPPPRIPSAPRHGRPSPLRGRASWQLSQLPSLRPSGCGKRPKPVWQLAQPMSRGPTRPGPPPAPASAGPGPATGRAVAGAPARHGSAGTGAAPARRPGAGRQQGAGSGHEGSQDPSFLEPVLLETVPTW
jgi:hypothetical protein